MTCDPLTMSDDDFTAWRAHSREQAAALEQQVIDLHAQALRTWGWTRFADGQGGPMAHPLSVPAIAERAGIDPVHLCVAPRHTFRTDTLEIGAPLDGFEMPPADYSTECLGQAAMHSNIDGAEAIIERVLAGSGNIRRRLAATRAALGRDNPATDLRYAVLRSLEAGIEPEVIRHMLRIDRLHHAACYHSVEPAIVAVRRKRAA